MSEEEVSKEELYQNSLQLADTYFPFKDGDNKPMYRSGQGIAIASVLKSFLMNDKKFMFIQGPVGFGKTGVNVTASLAMGSGRYIVPFKQLQDQIAKDCMVGVKSVKGKNAYTCNYLLECHGVKSTCAIKDNIKTETCLVAEGFSYDPSGSVNDMATLVATNIYNTIMSCETEAEMNKATSFSPRSLGVTLEWFKKNQDLAIEKVKDSIIDVVDKVVTIETSNDEPISAEDVMAKICCTMKPMECPSKSARSSAKSGGVIVMTPDIYVKLGKYIPVFRNGDVLVIDEGHKSPDFIRRVFGFEIPVDLLKDVFNVSIGSILQYPVGSDERQIEDHVMKVLEDKINPLRSLIDVFSELGFLMFADSVNDIFSAKGESSFDHSKKKIYTMIKDSFEESLKRTPVSKLLDNNFSMLRNFIIPILQGKNVDSYCYYEPFKIIREIVLKVIRQGKYKAYSDIAATYLLDTVTSLSDTVDHVYEEVIDNKEVSAVYYIRKHIGDLLDNIGNMLDAMTPLPSKDKEGDVEVNDQLVFLVDKKYGTYRKDLESIGMKLTEEEFKRINNNSRSLEIIPVNIGYLLNRYFYANVQKVIFSSATWVGKDSLRQNFGIGKGNVAFHEAPTTFNKSRRPVYVLSQRKGTIDLSNKTPDGEYFYKTRQGAKILTMHIQSLISEIKEVIRTNHPEYKNKGINIVIHSKTFEITKILAENWKAYNPSIHKFHMGIGDNTINEESGYNIDGCGKEELLDYIHSNHDSDIVSISPSISEGVDFKYGAARAQIIVKAPIPYFGDPYVKYMLKNDRSYITNVIFTELGQQYGRVMRAEDDWGYTYVYDSRLGKEIETAITQCQKDVKYSEKLNANYFLSGVRYRLTTYDDIANEQCRHVGKVKFLLPPGSRLTW